MLEELHVTLGKRWVGLGWVVSKVNVEKAACDVKKALGWLESRWVEKSVGKAACDVRETLRVRSSWKNGNVGKAVCVCL